MTSKAVLYDRGSPTITILNQSRVSDAKLRRIVAAMQKQIDRDFFPLWGWRAELELRKNPRKKAMQVIIGDMPGEDDDGVDGYHFIEGLPTTYVFTRNEQGKPLDYATTLSHELLEMIADPGVNLYALGYVKAGRRRRAFIPYEVCDPVQESTYVIDGVRVSNFVVPEWFEMEREPDSMKFDFRGMLSRPFELAPGGYIDAIVDNRIRTLWGEEANKKKRRHRHKARAAKI